MAARRADDMIHAGIGNRAFAFILDYILMIIVTGIAGGVLGVIARSILGPGAAFTVSTVTVFVVYFGYFIYFEGSRGQTLGKRLMDIRVVHEDGAPIGYRAATIRALFQFVDFLFVFLIAVIAILVTDKNQRLGDIVAGTVVIRQ